MVQNFVLACNSHVNFCICSFDLTFIIDLTILNNENKIITSSYFTLSDLAKEFLDSYVLSQSDKTQR